jgi:hypothetical protein
LVEIGLTLKDRKVVMHSCSRCDTRWWDSDGELLPLTSVLELFTPAARG